MQRGQAARMTFRLEPLAERLEDKVGAAERRGGGHRDHRAVGNARHGFGGADQLAHFAPP
jgi:hypothetical protein